MKYEINMSPGAGTFNIAFGCLGSGKPGAWYSTQKNRTWVIPKFIQVCFFISLLLTFSACNQPGKNVDVSHTYTCPMHPEIVRSEKGDCPICGMPLVLKGELGEPAIDSSLRQLIAPTNQYVLSRLPVTTLQPRTQPVEITALGYVGYDTREIGSIASRVAGRIEKLYVRYRFQHVSKGDRLLEIYSPELLTAQQNLLLLLKQDAGNTSFIQAAKEKLLLLGMSSRQLQQVMQTGKPAFTITVYSNYSGHLHEANSNAAMEAPGAGGTRSPELTTNALSLKEGMYLQQGETIFTISNPSNAWVVLNIYGDNQHLVRKGSVVRIAPEAAPAKDFRATIGFVEPFYREKSKTVTARVYFTNNKLKLPIGSQVSATIFGDAVIADWLPASAVVSLGLEKIVFSKSGNGFVPARVTIGMVTKDWVEIKSGLTRMDTVAISAQYLVDSESLININQ